MSVAEMKKELISKITELKSEKTLQEVLTLLNTAEEKESADLSQNDDDIKAQYEEVVHKLATMREQHLTLNAFNLFSAYCCFTIPHHLRRHRTYIHILFLL